MNKLGYFYIGVLLLCAFTTSQQVLGNDVLADLEHIFTDNVQIVDFDIQDDSTWSEAAAIQFDNERRLLLTETGSHPYPAEIQTMHHFAFRILDNYIISPYL